MPLSGFGVEHMGHGTEQSLPEGIRGGIDYISFACKCECRGLCRHLIRGIAPPGIIIIFFLWQVAGF